jgi:hypothetical protein
MKNPAAASKTAQNVIAIQARLKGAGVVYVSATGASELDHLGYMSRLGLWGYGSRFEQFVLQSINALGIQAYCWLEASMRAIQ